MNHPFSGSTNPSAAESSKRSSAGAPASVSTRRATESTARIAAEPTCESRGDPDGFDASAIALGATKTAFTGQHCNVELKARLNDLATARKIAERLATARLPTEDQRDTYFCCHQGRLKLREINGETACLIWYMRADDTDPKLSNFYIVDVQDPVGVKHVLTGAIGIRTIVNKRREIYLYQNVRIHLDEVQQQGAFLEFEAVLSESESELAGRQKVEFLVQQFKIQNCEVLAKSYADMD